MRKLLFGGVVAAAIMLGTTFNAYAVTIIKFGLSETIPQDIMFDGSLFETMDDGNALTPGDQNTALTFVGFLDGALADIIVPAASFTLRDVAPNGTPTGLGGLIIQRTTGGTFSVWDDSNNLLLSGELANGVIEGSTLATTGSFFTTGGTLFTGGSLFPLLEPQAALSFALSAIISGNAPGLRIVGGELAPFVADSTGQVEAALSRGQQGIPEPMTLGLLIPGLLGGLSFRRWRRA